MEQGPDTSQPAQFEQSKALAARLLQSYAEKLKQWQTPGNAGELSTEERRALEFGQSGIRFYLKNVSEQKQERFFGHGIIRRDDVGNLAALINILQTGNIKGDYARLKGSAMQNAFTNASFFIISHVDKPFARSQLSDDNETASSQGEERPANIGAYVVDTRFYPIVDELKQLFPNTNILRASELPAYIEAELASKPGS